MSGQLNGYGHSLFSWLQSHLEAPAGNLMDGGGFAVIEKALPDFPIKAKNAQKGLQNRFC
jgi:hypothetical protein